jgi:hypothetical protein
VKSGSQHKQSLPFDRAPASVGLLSDYVARVLSDIRSGDPSSSLLESLKAVKRDIIYGRRRMTNREARALAAKLPGKKPPDNDELAAGECWAHGRRSNLSDEEIEILETIESANVLRDAPPLTQAEFEDLSKLSKVTVNRLVKDEGAAILTVKRARQERQRLTAANRSTAAKGRSPKQKAKNAPLYRCPKCPGEWTEETVPHNGRCPTDGARLIA